MTESGAVDDELRRHEELLEQGHLASRVAVVRGRALSYGVRVPIRAPYLLRAKAEGVELVARSSGGTGLLHLDGDLLWAIVLPRNDPRVEGGFVRAYGRLGAGVVAALGRLGLAAAWQRPPGVSEAYCPLSSRGEVLWAGGKIVGAAAQHATAHAVLHHGSLSSAIDRATVARLFELAEPGPVDLLGSMAEAGLAATGESVANEVARSLRAAIGA